MEILLPFLKLLVIITLRYFVIAGSAFLIFYFLLSNKLAHKKIQTTAATKKDFLREILFSSQTNIILVAMASILLFTPLKNYTQIYTKLDEHSIAYLILSYVACLVIHDTYFYWMHRAIHLKFWYKHIHKVHHLSTNPSPFASFAFHFIESALEGLIIVILAFALPLHPIALFAFTFSSFMINVYGHLGYEIMPNFVKKTPIFNIFNTSVHHNMHHHYFEKNYGLYFRFWDKIMGTEHPEYENRFEQITSNTPYENSEK
jgi:lathosterol oxidase